MTQPNFLQVHNALDRAVEFVTAHPDLSSSSRYTASLIAMRDEFAAATASTDATYTQWRRRVGDELRGLRACKQVYDRALELADEHGYDDLPRHPIVYTERDHLFNLIEVVIAWLNAREGEWGWIPAQVLALTAAVADAKRTIVASGKLFDRYTVEVKRRIAAYEDAVALVREYIKDARREAATYDGFARVQIDVL